MCPKIPAVKAKVEAPTLTFSSPKEWEKWLKKNQKLTSGIWLRMYKKNTGIASVNYAEALDVALCYGWIDGQKKSFDELSWLQKFTPRRARSLWSKRNIEHVERLEKSGLMTDFGRKEVDAAKADGRWEQAYDSQSTMELPPEFLKELEKHKKAKEFFTSLSKANKFAIAWRIQTAKKIETKEKRIKTLVEMLIRGEKIHS
jgi:uncharacterized protein YdeI (YjbR/CyaY-like superfamily)